MSRDSNRRCVLVLIAAALALALSAPCAEAANGGGDTVAHRHYLPAAQLLNMTVTLKSNAPGGTAYGHQIAIDSIHSVIYVATWNINKFQRYAIDTGTWHTMSDGTHSSLGNQEYVGACVSADGTQVYMGVYSPVCKIQMLGTNTPWLYSSNFFIPHVDIAGGGSSGAFVPGYGTQARMGTMYNIRIRGNLLVGVHNGGGGECIYQVDRTNDINLVTQYVCDCSSRGRVDGVNNTARCGHPKGLSWTSDGTVLYVQEHVTKWIRKVVSTGSPSNPEVSIISLYKVCGEPAQCTVGSQLVGLVVHPFFDNVTLTLNYFGGAWLGVNGHWWKFGSTSTAGIDGQLWNSKIRNPQTGDIYDKDGSIWVVGRDGAGLTRICCLWTEGGSQVHYTEPSRHSKMSVNVRQFASPVKYKAIAYSSALDTVFVGGASTQASVTEAGDWNTWSTLSTSTTDSLIVTPDGLKYYYSKIGVGVIGSRDVDGTGYQTVLGALGSSTFKAGQGASGDDKARIGGFGSMVYLQDYLVGTDPNSNNCLGSYSPVTGELTHLACEIGATGNLDGPAISTATCTKPLGVNSDEKSGNIHFAQENGNHRKLTPQGYVVTISNLATYAKSQVHHPIFSGVSYSTFSATASLTYGGKTTGLAAGFDWDVSTTWSAPSHLFLGKPFNTQTKFFKVERVTQDTDRGALWVSAGGEGATYRICCLWENVTTTYTEPFDLGTMITHEASQFPTLSWQPSSAEYGYGTADGQFYLWIYKANTGLYRMSRKVGTVVAVLSDRGVSQWTDSWPNCFTVQQDATIYLGYGGYITSITATPVQHTTGTATIGAKGSSPGSWSAGTGTAATIGNVSSLATHGSSVAYLDVHNRMIAVFESTTKVAILVGCADRTSGNDIVDGLAQSATCGPTMNFASWSSDGHSVYWMENSGLNSGATENLDLVRKLVFATQEQSLGQIVTVYDASALVGTTKTQGMLRHPFYEDIFFIMLSTDLLVCRDGEVVKMKLQVKKTLQAASASVAGSGPMMLDTYRGVIYSIRSTKVYEVRSLWDGAGTPTEEKTETHSPSVTRSHSHSGTKTSTASAAPTSTATNSAAATVTATSSANTTQTQDGTITPSITTTQSSTKSEGRTESVVSSSTKSQGTQSSAPTATPNQTKTESSSQATDSASLSDSKTTSASLVETESATQGTRSATESVATFSTTLTHNKTLSPELTRSVEQNSTTAEQNSTTATRLVEKDRSRTMTDPPASPCVGQAVPAPLATSSLATQRLAEAQLRAGATKLVFGPLSYAAQWQGLIRDGADIPKAFVQLLLVRIQGEQPNPSGFHKYPQSSFNLTRLNMSYFSLTLGRDAGFSIEEDESALLVLRPGYFAFCPPTEDIPLLAISVEAAPTAAVVATKKAAEVVSGAATVASLAGSSGAALDAQSLAVIGLMSCAQPAERGALKNNRLLSPLATGDTYEGMIAGNWIMVAVVLTLHFGVACIVKMVKKLSHVEAQVLVKFPTLSLVAITVQFQGTASACVKLLQSGPGPASIVLGVFTISVTFCIPIGLFLLARKVLTVSFRNYAFDAPHLEKRFNKIAQLLMPQGRWWPKEMRKRFSCLFSGLRRPEKFWVTLPTWSPTVIVIGLMFEPSTSSACVAQFAVMSALQFVFVVVILGFRPYRSLIANLLAAASNMCLGFVLAGSAMLATDPESSTAVMFMLRGVQAQMAITVLRLLWSGIQYGLEHTIMKKLPMDELHGWEGTDEIERKRREAEKQQQHEEVGDESMQMLSEMLLSYAVPEDQDRPTGEVTRGQAPPTIGEGHDEARATNRAFGLGDLGEDILNVANTREEVAPTLTTTMDPLSDLEELAALMKKEEEEERKEEEKRRRKELLLRKDKNYHPDSMLNTLLTTQHSRYAPVEVHDQIRQNTPRTSGSSIGGDIVASSAADVAAFLSRGTPGPSSSPSMRKQQEFDL